MKILVLENQPSSYRGGQEWCFLYTCRGLAQCGNEIRLIYTEDGNLLNSYREFCKSIFKVNRYILSQDNLVKSSIIWFISLIRVLIRTLKFSPDLIYVNQYNNTVFGAALEKLKGISLVCHLHILPLKLSYPAQLGLNDLTSYRIGLESVTRFIAVSEVTRDAFLQVGLDPESIEVVYNGIDLKRFAIKNDRDQTRDALGLPPEAFVVFYAGRIDPPKNIEMLLQAFARLGLTAERARLLIVGSPVNHQTKAAGERYAQSLKSLCDSLGISNSVHWLGRRADLPEVYRAADVTVLPSMLPDTFGLVLAESMACGTPALGLRYGGIPEFLSGEFEKFLIEVGDIEGLTDLLHSVDGWQHKDPTLGQRCRAYFEQRFPVERAVPEVESVFKQVVALGGVRLGPSAKTVKAWNTEGTETYEKS